jgi:hypothetical protein
MLNFYYRRRRESLIGLLDNTGSYALVEIEDPKMHAALQSLGVTRFGDGVTATERSHQY